MRPKGSHSTLDARGFVDRRPDHREIESVDSADIAVQHLAEMKGQVDRGSRFARIAPRSVHPIDCTHRLGRCLERPMADVFPGCVLEGKDREHTVAEEFEHLSAARAQRSGQRLEYLVEQFDDYRARRRVGDGRKGADIGIPQHRTDAFDRAALDRSGMNSPAGVGAQISGEEARGDCVAGMRHHRQ